MCRTGGRRCKGSHASSRATQTTRKQRSRAQQALRQAKAAGDADAAAKAEQRLTQINAAASNVTKENTVPRNDKRASTGNAQGQNGDVTKPNAMETLRQMQNEMREREQAARDAAAKAGPQPDPVSDKVVKRLEGTCPNGHLVFVNTSVPGYLANSPAFASTDCPSCGGFVRLQG